MTPLDRRAFLLTAATACVGVLTGEWWGRRSEPVALAVPRTRIAGAAALHPGEALGVTLPESGIEALVVRLTSDRWAAFDRRCPHLGCPVLWSAAVRRFECPCHAASFGSNGAVLSGPPRRGLRRLGVTLRGGDVWVRGRADADT